MEKTRTHKTRKPGGGRKRLKLDYDSSRLLGEQMKAVVALHASGKSLQAIADRLSLNPMKVRKLLITAGVYQSEIADNVQRKFQEYRKTQDYKNAISSTVAFMKLSRSSVNSYLPYEKGVYVSEKENAEKISVGAERQRRYRAVKKWREDPTEEHLWNVISAYRKFRFKTCMGIPFSYEIIENQNGEYTRELRINCGESVRSVPWALVLRVYATTSSTTPDDIADGLTKAKDSWELNYIYGIFHYFGMSENYAETSRNKKINRK